MSNATQTVFTGVGAVVGFVMGGPVGALQGASIGYQIGSAIDPDVQHREGPRLTDKRVQGGAYGQPITELYGDGYVRPFLAWAIPLTEVGTTTREGGKGGPPPTETTTYTAYLTCAFVLAKGQCKLKRIKADGRVIWDVSSASTGPIATSGPSFMLKALGKITSGTPEYSFEYYEGTPDQSPSAIMQEHLGVDWTPAYRGRALIVLKNFSLGPYGSRIPLFEFELIRDGVYAPIFYPWFSPAKNAPTDAVYPTQLKPAVYSAKNDSVIIGGVTAIAYAGFAGTTFAAYDPVTRVQKWQTFANVGDEGNYIYDDSTGIIWARGPNSLILIDSGSGGIIRSSDAPTFALLISSTFSVVLLRNSIAFNTAQGEVWLTNESLIHVCDKKALETTATFFPINTATKYTISLSFWGGQDGTLRELPHRKQMLIWTNNASGVQQARVFDQFGRQSGDPFQLGDPSLLVGHVMVDEGNDCLWVLQQNDRLWKTDLTTRLSTFIKDLSPAADGPAFVDLDPGTGCAVIYNKNTHLIEWVDASGALVSSVDVSSIEGLGQIFSATYIAEYNKLIITSGSGTNGMTAITFADILKASGTVPVSFIIQEKINQSGIPVGKSDVSQVTEVIDGMQYEGLMQARDQIAALKSIGQFDLGMSNGNVTAKKRGGASVKAVSYLDLVASPDGTGTLEVVHSDNQDVPGSVEVGFQDPAADFEVSYQSVVRPTAVNGEIKRFQVPASISAAQAKRIAESEMYLAEFRRRGYTLPTTAKHIDIEQYDPFDFQWSDGRVTRMVAQRIEYSFPLKLSIVAIEDNSALHTLTSTGVPSGSATVYPEAAGGVVLHMLDIPLLMDSDNYPGFYVRVSASSSSFSYASLYESIDGGITYSLLGPVSIGPSGYAISKLNTFSGGAAWDYINTVDVVVGVGDTVESYTEAQIYAGLGGWLLGSEIIQAKDATLIATRTYRLSNLLRSRKGTEWAVGSHVIGERAIPLDGAVKRFNSSAYNISRLYKVAAPGQALEDVSAQYFSNQQIGMKPLSPDNITATRDGSGNITLLWWGRSRVGTAWGPAYDMPLDEDIEKFEIDIMSGVTVKRTITVLGPFSVQPTAPYPASDQTTDFGSLRTEGTLLVNIYKISSLVGRGYVGSKTV